MAKHLTGQSQTTDIRKGNVSTIKFNRDDYVNGLIEQGTATAQGAMDASKNQANNAFNTTQNQLNTNYGNNRNTFNDNLQQNANLYNQNKSNLQQQGFQNSQQAREMAASRGLGMSGVGQAIESNAMAQNTAQINALNTEYSNAVNQIRQDVSTLVNNYGLDIESANEILQNNLTNIQDQYNSAIKEATASANAQGDVLQRETDQFNAAETNAWNKMQAQLAQEWEIAQQQAALQRQQIAASNAALAWEKELYEQDGWAMNAMNHLDRGDASGTINQTDLNRHISALGRFRVNGDEAGWNSYYEQNNLGDIFNQPVSPFARQRTR